jgi:hypothetical protein
MSGRPYSGSTKPCCPTSTITSPRGRINWRKEDDRWLLLLDPKLNRSSFITHIVTAWKIPRHRLLVLTDAHYRSVARVGPPQ